MAGKKPDRVLIVDDHEGVRAGLAFLLEHCDDLEYAGEAANGLDAIQLCNEIYPDVVFMDLMMPYMDGIEATRTIHQKQPEIVIIALTHVTDRTALQAVLDAGAVAHMPKDTSAEKFIQIIRQAKNTSESTFTQDTQQSSNVQILIVEDEAIVALDLQNQLKKLGYSICGIASSGSEAIQHTKTCRPDLVLMDIQLKGQIDGIETAREIYSIYEIPVIYLTAQADTDTLQRARKSQPFGYIIKPFEIRTLHSTIEMALYKHDMEKKLKESEAKFRMLVEVNPEMITIAKLTADLSIYKLLYANSASEATTGYTLEELMLLNHFDIIHPMYQKNLRQQAVAVLLDRSIPAYDEIKIVKKTGYEAWLGYSLRKIEYENQTAIIMTAFDITERKQAAQHKMALAIEVERRTMLEQFISDASHDLKTPLATIKANLFLLRRLEDTTRRDNALATIDSQTTRLENMLDDILNMARLDANPDLKLKQMDLNESLAQLLAALEATIADKNLSLQVDLSPGVLPIAAEAIKLDRAINNIVVNSIIYTPPGGTITVRTYRDHDKVGIEISDTGEGISTEDLPHIFKRFYRADKTRNAQKGGTGLGLAIAKSIVETHNGTIGVDSTIGQGSTFKIILPSADNDIYALEQNGTTSKQAL